MHESESLVLNGSFLKTSYPLTLPPQDCIVTVHFVLLSVLLEFYYSFRVFNTLKKTQVCPLTLRHPCYKTSYATVNMTTTSINLWVSRHQGQ